MSGDKKNKRIIHIHRANICIVYMKYFGWRNESIRGTARLVGFFFWLFGKAAKITRGWWLLVSLWNLQMKPGFYPIHSHTRTIYTSLCSMWILGTNETLDLYSGTKIYLTRPKPVNSLFHSHISFKSISNLTVFFYSLNLPLNHTRWLPTAFPQQIKFVVYNFLRVFPTTTRIFPIWITLIFRHLTHYQNRICAEERQSTSRPLY